MAQPPVRDVHVDVILTHMSLAFIQQLTHFIASRVFPNVPVPKQTNKYFIYTQADWFRDEARRRGDSQESAGSGYNLSTATYNCDVFSLHKDIGDQVQANADLPLNPERDAMQFVVQRLLLRREIQFQSDVFKTGVWTTDKTGGTNFTKWSSDTGSDPIEDIEAGIEKILNDTGQIANTLVLGYKAFRILKNHASIVDRIKYTGGLKEQVKAEVALAQLFGFDNVYVARAIKNTALEGATASYSFVQTNTDALILHVNPQPSPLTPSAGYTFVWTDVSDGLGLEIGTRSFNMPELGKKHIRIESEIAMDHKIVAKELGYFFSTAV